MCSLKRRKEVLTVSRWYTSWYCYDTISSKNTENTRHFKEKWKIRMPYLTWFTMRNRFGTTKFEWCENSGKPYKSRLPVFCACKMLAVYFDSVGLILSPLKSNGKESKKSISSTSFALLCVSIFTSDGIWLKSWI